MGLVRNQTGPLDVEDPAVCNGYLDPGDSLLRLHHPGGLGRLALAHQLGGPEIASSEEDTFYQNFGISHRT